MATFKIEKLSLVLVYFALLLSSASPSKIWRCQKEMENVGYSQAYSISSPAHRNTCRNECLARRDCRGVQYRAHDKCWFISDEYCNPKCQRSDRYYYCYISTCEIPRLLNANVSVNLHESKGENFQVECKPGYILPDGKYSDTIICDKKGFMERTIFDCVSEEGEILFYAGSLNFKCKPNVIIATGTQIDSDDNVQEVQTYLDKCAQSSKCR